MAEVPDTRSASLRSATLEDVAGGYSGLAPFLEERKDAFDLFAAHSASVASRDRFACSSARWAMTTAASMISR